MIARLVSFRFLHFGLPILFAGTLAATGADATTLTISKSNGTSQNLDTASLVDSSVHTNKAAAGDWGRSIGSAKTSSKANSTQLFKVAASHLGGLVISGPGFSRQIQANPSGNIIPASLVANVSPPGLENVGRGLDVAPGAPTAVPLPAAAWLFISALLGLVLVGRQRRQYAATS